MDRDHREVMDKIGGGRERKGGEREGGRERERERERER